MHVFYKIVIRSQIKFVGFAYHCVVIFFWSSGIIDSMFVYIWKWSSAHALGGVSGVASFITTDEQLQ